MNLTLGLANKLLNDLMTNYSQWHTERAPTGKKVNSVEEVSSLSDKIDMLAYLLAKQVPIDPNNVPLNSLVANENDQIDVNFIARNNFNNSAYKNNFGSNNYRPYPNNNNGNPYRNSYENTSNDKSMPSYERIIEIETATKKFMHTQYEQNRVFSKQLGEHSAILRNINEQLAGLTNEISNLQRRLDTTETYI